MSEVGEVQRTLAKVRPSHEQVAYSSHRHGIRPWQQNIIMTLQAMTYTLMDGLIWKLKPIFLTVFP